MIRMRNITGEDRAPVLTEGPLVERHPQKIAEWLSARAQRKVAFDHVETEWTRRGPLFAPSRFYRVAAPAEPGWQGWLRQLFSTPSAPCPEPVPEVVPASTPPSSSIRRGGVKFSG